MRAVDPDFRLAFFCERGSSLRVDNSNAQRCSAQTMRAEAMFVSFCGTGMLASARSSSACQRSWAAACGSRKSSAQSMAVGPVIPPVDLMALPAQNQQRMVAPQGAPAKPRLPHKGLSPPAFLLKEPPIVTRAVGGRPQANGPAFHVEIS
jgi:hypothetical protein